MATKTKTPTGLKINRGDIILTETRQSKFVISWKIADADHKAGQKLYCQLGTLSSVSTGTNSAKGKEKKIKYTKKESLSVSNTATSKSKTVNLKDYYPMKADGPFLVSFKATVKGKRKKYKEKKKTITPDWSKEATKVYTLYAPPRPIISEELVESNTTVFSWSLDNYEKDGQMFYDYEWQSVLVRDADTPSWDTIDIATYRNGKSGSSITKKAQDTSAPGETSWEVAISETGIDTLRQDYSYTRWIRVRARGLSGYSKWVEQKHTYTQPSLTNNLRAGYQVYTEKVDGQDYKRLQVKVEWDAPNSKAYPIDVSTVEYAIVTPSVSYSDDTETDTRIMDISYPSGAEGEWVAASKYTDTAGKNGIMFYIDRMLYPDEMLFVRVNTTYDGVTNRGMPILAGELRYLSTPVRSLYVGQAALVDWDTSDSSSIGGILYKNEILPAVGRLAAPAGVFITPPPEGSNIVEVDGVGTSEVVNSFLAVYYRESVDEEGRCIGIIPYNKQGAGDTVPVIAPTWPTGVSPSFGVRAFVANYSPIDAFIDDVTDYAIDNIRMQSDSIKWDPTGSIPLPPNIHDLTSPSNGVILVTWDWTWKDADSVELSWADNKDAWESTNPPSTYIVSNTHIGRWKITGLNVGTWYVRLRFIRYSDSGIAYGTYSELKEIKLASAPDIPNLVVMPTVIAEDGSATATWIYSTKDGTTQSNATVCEAITDDETGTVSYDIENAKFANTAQSMVIKPEDWGWHAGEVHSLCIKVTSASGETSEEWSKPVAITIAEKLTATIDTTPETLDDGNLVYKEVKEFESLYLVDLPLTVHVSGAGDGGTTTVAIERSGNSDYRMIRPDQDEAHEVVTGFVGDTIALKDDQDGSGVIRITYNDLIGSLDDGADYKIIATVTDTHGQTDSDELPFIVAWDHQAVMPEAVITPSIEDAVTFIRPIQPDGYEEGDFCDIYRLSSDKPELIVPNAEFGTLYVDPYPALGEFGGHRIVYRTRNGDYIANTEDGERPAWTDYTNDDGDTLDVFAIIIDFETDSIRLPYDISLSHSWTKDFTETKYLGGSVVGDWKHGVSRKTSAKTTTVILEDPDHIKQMRRLSEYSGICHVRTPDGSSFSADVQVTEDREERWVNKVSKFSLSITRVDSEDYDGLPYEEWYTEETPEEEGE